MVRHDVATRFRRCRCCKQYNPALPNIADADTGFGNAANARRTLRAFERIMKDAQADPDFVIIARTDAIAVAGFSAAIDRSHAYLEAGADVTFVEAPDTLAQIEDIARRIPQPTLINMFFSGKTPLVPTARLRELGYKFIIIPSDLQRATIKATQRVLAAIHRDGDSHAMADDMVAFGERERIIDSASYLAL